MATRRSAMRYPSKEKQAPSAASRTTSITEDLPFQKRQWVAERIGWVLMLCVIVGALAGITGGAGPLARATAGSADGRIDVEFARFARYASPTVLDINVVSAPASGPIRVRISKQFLDAMKVQSIVPAPVARSIADGHHMFVFERPASAAKAKIQLQLEPAKVGFSSGWIAVDDGAQISFKQFVYP